MVIAGVPAADGRCRPAGIVPPWRAGCQEPFFPTRSVPDTRPSHVAADVALAGGVQPFLFGSSVGVRATPLVPYTGTRAEHSPPWRFFSWTRPRRPVAATRSQ